MKGKISNDFADIVNVNGRTLQKIDLSLGSSSRSELAVHVTTGDIRIVAFEPDPGAASQDASITANK